MSLWHASAVDRVFQRIQVEENPNILYLHHPSGVTVLSLNAYNLVLKSPVTSVDFNVGKKAAERGGQLITGKGKKGALLVQKETKLCIIRCADGTETFIRVGVKGNLLEVNERLKTNPDLVRTSPENQGFIAIITYGGGKRRLVAEGSITVLPKKRIYLKEKD